MAENYYTLQIHYGNPEKPTVEEWKDLTAGTTPEKQWKRELREKLFLTGFTVRTSPIGEQFISPFVILTAFLIKQDKKFGV